MSTSIAPAATGSIYYPETDGQPMAENTKQFRWIVTLAGNLAALFRDRQDVFVSGNQFWYPVEGEPELRVAPDVYVVFDRPKGERSSYQQWKENHVPLTVVMEVLSPGNSGAEMANKGAFYDDHGVEEYYLYDPDTNSLHGYRRSGSVLVRIRPMNGFVSPRLGIQFDLSGSELVVRYPDGRPFLTFEQLANERDQEKQRADQEKQRADQEKQRADTAEQRLMRLTELSRKTRHQQATPDEMQELQRLLEG